MTGPAPVPCVPERDGTQRLWLIGHALCAGLVSDDATRDCCCRDSWRSDDRGVALYSPSTLSAESCSAGGRSLSSCRGIRLGACRRQDECERAANGVCLSTSGLFASGDGEPPIGPAIVGRVLWA